MIVNSKELAILEHNDMVVKIKKRCAIMAMLKKGNYH